MENSINRPEWNCESTKVSRRALLASAVASPLLVPAAGVFANEEKSAPTPSKSGRHTFPYKVSLAAYSFNALLPRGWEESAPPKDKMTLSDFIAFCAEQGLDGCELTSYYFPRSPSQAYLTSIRSQAFHAGLAMTGTAIGNDFCLPDGPARDATMALTRSWIDHAVTIGAPTIRVFAGYVPKGDTEQAAFERCVRGLSESVEYAASKGICLGLENHGGITSTPEQLLKIFHAIPATPALGINFDSGNFRSGDPYADLEKIAPYAVNAQVKVVVTRNGKKEPTDYGRVIEILRAAGYPGFVILEYEGEKVSREIVANALKDLKAAAG